MVSVDGVKMRKSGKPRMLEYRGEVRTLSHWARRFRMRKQTLTARLQRGMSVREALETPVREWRRN